MGDFVSRGFGGVSEVSGTGKSRDVDGDWDPPVLPEPRQDPGEHPAGFSQRGFGLGDDPFRRIGVDDSARATVSDWRFTGPSTETRAGQFGQDGPFRPVAAPETNGLPPASGPSTGSNYPASREEGELAGTARQDRNTDPFRPVDPHNAPHVRTGSPAPQAEQSGMSGRDSHNAFRSVVDPSSSLMWPNVHQNSPGVTSGSGGNDSVFLPVDQEERLRGAEDDAGGDSPPAGYQPKPNW